MTVASSDIRATPPTGCGPLLSIEDLTVEFWNGEEYERVVNGVSLHVARGEAVGLVGESGCGKTTSAYSVLAYLQPGSRLRSGRVLFDGQDVLGLAGSDLRRIRGGRIGHVPQDPTLALNPNIRVGKQITEVLANHSWQGDRSGRALSLLAAVGIDRPETVFSSYSCQLSGGQQQRVMIAMAVACEPELVVLDEPTTGLDVTTQAMVIDLLRELRASRDTSLLYVTHDLGVVAALCDRVVVMYGGKVIESAPTAELFAAPRHPYTKALIDSVPTIAAGSGPGKGLGGRFERRKIPPGCPFAPRCPLAVARCEAEAQSLLEATPGHVVACWRSGEPARDTVTGDAEPEMRLESRGEGLVVSSLSCSYTGRRRWTRGRADDTVVRDVSFEIELGETVALVGESGSGKSTIARAIAGLLPRTGGNIRFAGEPLSVGIDGRSRDQLRRVQIVFQNPDASLNPRHTVGRIVGRALRHYFGLGSEEAKVRARRRLADVQLDERLAARFPRDLSGGERQRVALARALGAEPNLLLCDEVLSALDVSVQASMVSLLRDLQQEHHFSMLFISHDLAVVRWLARRVVVLYRGQLCEAGETGRILSSPLHPYTATLLASIPGSTGGHERPILTGTPSGAATGRGCVVASRCPFRVGEICDRVTPPEVVDSDGTRVRCHIPLSDLEIRMRPDAAEPRLSPQRGPGTGALELP
ncbi:MAG: ABC transporter ATP-binding protein [Actinomycetota bacterium]|nr:ABC transporter ATP-binding protein [Actinomycetota bacterium]